MDGARGSAGTGASRLRQATRAVWALFALHLVFAAIVLPPWQNPDEPPHFAVIWTLARQPTLDLSRRGDRAVQGPIIDSMAEHGWWEAYGERRPDPLPRIFVEAAPLHLGEQGTLQYLYYLAASRYCRLVGVDHLLRQYYALRTLSLFITLLTFGVILRAARESFGEEVALATGAVVALVPQFAIIGVSVSPDPLVYLAGAFVWWQAVRIAGGHGVVLPVAGMVAATAVAVLSKRLAFPLVVQTGLLTMIAVAATMKSARTRMLTMIVMAGVFLAAVGGVALLLAQRQAGGVASYAEWIGWKGRPFSPGYFLEYTWTLFQTGYLAAGWQRFFPPVPVFVVALAVCVFGTTRGAVTSLLAKDRRVRTAALLALVFVGVQLWSVYGTKFYLEGAPGRFLFAATGPLAALCAFGLVRWNSSRTRAVAGCVIVGGMAVLDVVGWVTTVIPAYVR